MINIKKLPLVVVLFGLLLIPSYAYDVDLTQWEDLEMEEEYENEFMLCYLRNSTHLIWDTYQEGEANFITPDSTWVYDLYCCDNCRIENNISVHLSPNSLHYQVDNSISISENTDLDYAINDIIEEHRTLATLTSGSGTILNRFDDFKFGDLIPIEGTMISIFVLTIPLTAWIFTADVMITMMALGISLIVGVFIAYSWGLMGFGSFILVSIMLVAIMWFMSKMMIAGRRT